MSRTPLIVFSHLRWDFVHQRPQHVMRRIARWRPVLFVEEPDSGEGEPWLEVSDVAPNLQVARATLPEGGGAFRAQGRDALCALLAEEMARRCWSACAAWLYTPMAVGLAKSLTPRAIVYDCMDELSAFKDAPAEMVTQESELLSCADVVMTGGPSLFAAKRDRHPRVHFFPSSVDLAHFGLTPHLRDADEQTELPHPRLGFFGVIDERMDLEILELLATSHPEWHTVLVGPVVKIDSASLPRHPNLHYLGSRSYQDLPSYLAGWDLCLVPFAMNEATRYSSPTKSLEYMAADRTIVSTPIVDIVDLYRDIVFLGQGPRGFVEACERALAMTTEERAARRARARQVLSKTSWDETVRKMEQILHAIAEGASRAPATAAVVPARGLPVEEAISAANG